MMMVTEKKEKEKEKEKEVGVKYAHLITLLECDNTMWYGALFRQLFADFATEHTHGPIRKSIPELAALLDRASVKLSCKIHNMTMPQLLKLYKLLMTKLKGTHTLRPYDADIMVPLMFRMYSDAELDTILSQLDKIGMTDDIVVVAVNAKDEIVFQNKMKYPLPPSGKLQILHALLN